MMKIKKKKITIINWIRKYVKGGTKTRMDTKVLGIKKQVDNNGRIVIPYELRKALGIELNGYVELTLVKKNKNETIIEIKKG